MGRLPGFDYKRPFFYMVTIKRREGAAVEPFSAIAADGRIVASAITEAFLRVIEAFHETWYCMLFRDHAGSPAPYHKGTRD